MTGAGSGAEELIDVHLIGLPPAIHRAAQEHIDGLLREFSHIAHAESRDPGSTPRRLLELVQALRVRYAPFTAAPRQEIELATARGDDAVDIVCRVPAGAADAADELSALLDEADEFCRSGALLTLAATAQVVRYRHWLLGEFRRQADGAAPTPWSAS